MFKTLLQINLQRFGIILLKQLAIIISFCYQDFLFVIFDELTMVFMFFVFSLVILASDFT